MVTRELVIYVAVIWERELTDVMKQIARIISKLRLRNSHFWTYSFTKLIRFVAILFPDFKVPAFTRNRL